MASIEEKVEEHYKKELDSLKIRHYGKTEPINQAITDALKSANSKSGGSGNNYPDIKLLLENNYSRRIPVMRLLNISFDLFCGNEKDMLTLVEELGTIKGKIAELCELREHNSEDVCSNQISNP